ncbi:DEAD/DEAH box helicase [Allocoleopsis franciscana]|uniref:Helicase family protein with metal-binding cysteine cluster n=1 Tax=Allocoleopsis franciscana PCC 7113 TaxID=1173027 RepID=K9WQI0_9CYAN|nr:DEAD/DEAH box helicase [Allocoleopsis franciscana]AFZ22044.1 helicase family protein with metal-binding cysteine cluster [Allocoleopsis franciscana PCC 7113]
MTQSDNIPNNTSSHQPDYTALLQATLGEIPTLPEWLAVGQSVYSLERGFGEVVGCLGRRLIIQFEKSSQPIFLPNWPLAVEQKHLIKASDAPAPEPIPEIEQMGVPTFRKFATEVADSLVAVDVMPPAKGELHPLPTDLPDALLNALQHSGIQQIYSHQLEALMALRSGKDICLVTATSSGKTLSFSIPILESCLNNPNICVLMLYPLKALAVDQMEKLATLNAALPPEKRLKIGLITGDTPISERKQLFSDTPPQILGLSPDLLHYQLYSVRMADGEPFREFLRRLRYVVVDESHTYLGAFGAGVTNLFRRLRVAVDRVSGDSSLLQWVFASATIGNPNEMALRLSGREATPERLVLIDKSGAASAGRTLLHLKPSNSANPDAAKIILSLLDKDLSGICFCNSRSAVKSLLSLIKQEAIRQGCGYLSDSVAVFYGSLKSDRRQDIIRQLQRGQVRFILSTSALEAGLDLPELDCCLIRGWPGSLMSFRQRIGRAGRRSPGLAIFLPVAQSPLDNYYSNNPQILLHGEAETVSMNPDYPVLLGKHLMACCVESGVPLHRLSEYFGERAGVIADALIEQGQLCVSRHGQLWGRGYPHKQISLRGSRTQTIQLIDSSTGEEFEEMSLDMAQREVYAGAIYTAQSVDGEICKFQSKNLDVEGLRASLIPIDPESNAFTIAQTDLDIQLLDLLAEPKTLNLSIAQGQLSLTLGWGKITSSVTGYKLCVKQYAPTCVNRSCRQYHQPLSGKSCSVCGQRLKSMELVTVIDEVEFEEPLQIQYQAPIVKVEANSAAVVAMIERVRQLKEQVRSAADVIPPLYASLWESSPEFIALHSMGHQIIFTVPLVVLSSSSDLNYVVVKEQGDETVGYFYDACEGGNGASEAIFHQFSKFSQKAYTLAIACDCEAGCPKCLHQHGCPQTNTGLNKQIGLFLLEAINRGSQDTVEDS